MKPAYSEARKDIKYMIYVIQMNEQILECSDKRPYYLRLLCFFSTISYRHNL